MAAFHGLVLWGSGAAALAAPVAAWRVRGRLRGAHLVLGAACGAALLPAVVMAVVAVGRVLGLPYGAARPPVGDPLVLAWGVAAAPLVEEALYRGWLLPALHARLGAGLALLASSACFALPHAGAWDGLATFLVGLGLGAAFLATRSLGLCVGLHAGLNAAALVRGVP